LGLRFLSPLSDDLDLPFVRWELQFAAEEVSMAPPMRHLDFIAFTMMVCDNHNPECYGMHNISTVVICIFILF